MKIQVPDLTTSRRPGTYLVGGCVRDLIQGLKPRDYDMVVSGDPRALAEEIAAAKGGRCFTLGKGELTVFCVAAPQLKLDIMSYKGADINEDLLSRDFTINALACSLADGRIIDVTGGMEDLRRRVVRMISPRAFQVDPVRLVRAFRMAAALNFTIEAETITAIKTHSALLQQSAAERIWAELQQILGCPDSHRHIIMMYDSNVLPTILPELVEIDHHHRNLRPEANEFDRALEEIQALEAILTRPRNFLPPAPGRFVESLAKESRVLLKMAMLLRKIGKSQCRGVDAMGRVRHHGHAAGGAALAHAIGRRLKMSNRQREWLASIIRRHQRPRFLYLAGRGRQGPPPRAIGRFFRQCGVQAPHLLMLSIAGAMAHPKNDRYREFLIEMLTRYVDKIDRKRRSPILNGQILMDRFNLQPSPVLGTLLRRVDELYLGGLILDREQALQWIAGQLKKNTPRPTAGGA